MHRNSLIGVVAAFLVLVGLSTTAWLWQEPVPPATPSGDAGQTPSQAIDHLAFHGVMVGGHRALVSAPTTNMGASNLWCAGQFTCDLHIPQEVHRADLRFRHIAELSAEATFVAIKGEQAVEADDEGWLRLEEPGVWTIRAYPGTPVHPSWVYSVQAWMWTHDPAEALSPQPVSVAALAGYLRAGADGSSPGAWCWDDCALDRSTNGDVVHLIWGHNRLDAVDASIRIGNGQDALVLEPGFAEVPVAELPDGDRWPVTVLPEVAAGDLAWYLEVQVFEDESV